VIRTLVIGVDPDKDTPAFASVLIGSDHSLRVLGVGLGGEKPTIANAVLHHILWDGNLLLRDEDFSDPTPARCFIESPEAVYTKGKGIRVQDIVDLARRAGEMAASIYSLGITEIDYISPAQWKGQVPKDISQARICTRLGWPYEKMAGYARPTTGFSNVSGTEALKKSDWKHVLDAIGIALWGADTIISIDRRAAAVARSK
jgi:hypothetical protein